MIGTAAESTQDDHPFRQYLNFVCWSIPSLLAVTFSHIYLVPKIELILDATGMKPGQLPGHLDAYFAVDGFLSRCSWMIVSAVVAIAIILEWRFSSWYRFRCFFLGFIAYIINAFGLVAVTFLAIAAVALATVLAA